MMLSRLVQGVRSLTSDPWVLGAVGMILLTRSFELIGAEVTAQAELLKRQVAEAQAQVGVAVVTMPPTANGAGTVPVDQPEAAPSA
jgi:hypothetical protein